MTAATAKEKAVGEWVHLTGVLTADKQVEIYVNGELSATAEATELIESNPAQALEIGADAEGNVGDYRSPFNFDGVIDEVRVYYGSITQEEIAKHYSDSPDKEVEEADLVLAMSFDGEGAKDESGNENHGKALLVEQVPGKVGSGIKFSGPRDHRGDSFVEHHWTQEIPFLVRAMVLAGETLFIAGPPDVLDEEEALNRIGEAEIQAKIRKQDAALEGEEGALLWAVSPTDGTKLAEYELETPPTWDGMAACNGRLYMTTQDGNVLCFGGS